MTNRDSYYRTRYDITEAEYNKLLEFQQGGCAICGKYPTKRRLAVDHNHRTGEVRGLLCWLCNRGLAFFHDNATLARNVAEYLENHPYKLMRGKLGKLSESASAHAVNPQHFRVFEPGRGGSILELSSAHAARAKLPETLKE